MDRRCRRGYRWILRLGEHADNMRGLTRKMLKPLWRSLFLQIHGAHDTWDLSRPRPIADPYLESVRQRCQSVRGHDADPTAKDHVRAILSELRAHT